MASGPWQTEQRAAVRQRSHASAAAYPSRGVCTSTGPVARASPTTSCTGVGIRDTAGERVARELGVAGPGHPDA